MCVRAHFLSICSYQNKNRLHPRVSGWIYKTICHVRYLPNNHFSSDWIDWYIVRLCDKYTYLNVDLETLSGGNHQRSHFDVNKHLLYGPHIYTLSQCTMHNLQCDFNNGTPSFIGRWYCYCNNVSRKQSDFTTGIVMRWLMSRAISSVDKKYQQHNLCHNWGLVLLIVSFFFETNTPEGIE